MAPGAEKGFPRRAAAQCRVARLELQFLRPSPWLLWWENDLQTQTMRLRLALCCFLHPSH